MEAGNSHLYHTCAVNDGNKYFGSVILLHSLGLKAIVILVYWSILITYLTCIYDNL